MIKEGINPFKGYAVMCDTWQQIEHLSRVAKSLGYTPFKLSESDFKSGENLFSTDPVDTTFTNFGSMELDGEEVIRYEEFAEHIPPDTDTAKLAAIEEIVREINAPYVAGIRRVNLQDIKDILKKHSLI